MKAELERRLAHAFYAGVSALSTLVLVPVAFPMAGPARVARLARFLDWRLFIVLHVCNGDWREWGRAATKFSYRVQCKFAVECPRADSNKIFIVNSVVDSHVGPVSLKHAGSGELVEAMDQSYSVCCPIDQITLFDRVPFLCW
jgi:hypothetical protein